jgi:hypothetical protein
MAIIGLLSIILGAVMSLIPVQGPSVHIALTNEVLTSTKRIELGKLIKDQRVRVVFECNTTMLFMIQNRETREYLKVLPVWTTGGGTAQAPPPVQVINASMIGYLSPAVYTIPETAEYDVIIDNGVLAGTPSKSVKIVFLNIEAPGIVETPYLIPGIGLVVVGVVVALYGIMRGRGTAAQASSS